MYEFSLRVARIECRFSMPPRGTKELSLDVHGAIVAIHPEGISLRKIAQKIGIAPSTIKCTVNRFREHGSNHSLPHSGRPHATSERKRRYVIRLIKANRFASYKAIAEVVGNISAHQVYEITRSENYHCRVAHRKPYISPQTAKKRLEWAQSNASLDWTSVLWTDECSFEVGEHKHWVYVTRKPGEEFLPQTIQPTFRSG